MNRTPQYKLSSTLSRLARSVASLVVMVLACAASSARADYESAVLADGPIGFWRLNEVAGTTADNLGTLGAGADGTYAGTVTLGSESPVGFPGLGFGNSSINVGPGDGWVQTGQTLLSNRTAFTMSGFIRPADRATTRIGLFGQNDAVEFGFIDPATIQIWTPGGGSLNVAYPFASNEWHHIATVGNGTDLRVYFDGQLAGTGGVATADYGGSTFGFNIGGGGIYDTAGNQFTGLVDEVALFDEALSAQQILAHFEAAQMQVIPEPSSLLLAALGAASLSGIAWRRRRRRPA